MLASIRTQLSGIPGRRAAAALRTAGAALLIATGCASSRTHGANADGESDAGPPDAGSIAHSDARELPDARVPADAAPELDATPTDAQPACAISQQSAPALDGNGDLAKYAATNVTAPGAPLAGSDDVAITWDANDLYVTATSDAFLQPYEPLHIYIEEGAAPLPAAVPGTGKEYSSLTPQLPFTATHLIAIRRVSDAGTGAYDGVFTPAAGWTTRATPLVEGTDVFASSDQKTLSARVPWTALGRCPTALRLAVHVVHGVAANEWKDLLPATATPWLAPGGSYFQIDLTQPPAMSGWAIH